MAAKDYIARDRYGRPYGRRGASWRDRRYERQLDKQGTAKAFSNALNIAKVIMTGGDLFSSLQDFNIKDLKEASVKPLKVAGEEPLKAIKIFESKGQDSFIKEMLPDFRKGANKIKLNPEFKDYLDTLDSTQKKKIEDMLLGQLDEKSINIIKENEMFEGFGLDSFKGPKEQKADWMSKHKKEMDEIIANNPLSITDKDLRPGEKIGLDSISKIEGNEVIEHPYFPMLKKLSDFSESVAVKEGELSDAITKFQAPMDAKAQEIQDAIVDLPGEISENLFGYDRSTSPELIDSTVEGVNMAEPGIVTSKEGHLSRALDDIVGMGSEIFQGLNRGDNALPENILDVFNEGNLDLMEGAYTGSESIQQDAFQNIVNPYLKGLYSEDEIKLLQSLDELDVNISK